MHRLALAALPYGLDALAPHISRRTLATHHGKHHAAYLAKTRSLVAGTPLDGASLTEIVRASHGHADPALFHAAAQAWNHDFYWHCMRPDGGGEATGDLAEQIAGAFGSHEAFCQAFTSAAVDQFGSGWAWLVRADGHLRVTATANAGTPLVDGQVPLLVIDLWEHAYYLDYQQRRADYVAAFLAHLVNWDFARDRLCQCRTDESPPARAPAPV